MRPTNWNALHAFWLVAEHGSFVAAAGALPWGSVQSLHKRVRELESGENLGLRLLRSRGVKGVELTEAGRRLHDFVDPVFDSLDVLLAELRGEDSGPLAVAMTSYVVRNHADQILTLFRAAYPKVTLKVYSGDGAEVVSLVDSGHAMLGICGPPAPLSKALVIKARAPVHFVILAPADWRFADKPITWAELVERPFVVPERRGMIRQALEHVLRQENLIPKLQIAAEVATLDLMLAAVKAGYGMALFPVDPRFTADLGDVVRITPPTKLPGIDTAVICKDGVYLPRYMVAFVEVAGRILGCESPVLPEAARRQPGKRRVRSLKGPRR